MGLLSFLAGTTIGKKPIPNTNNHIKQYKTAWVRTKADIDLASARSKNRSSGFARRSNSSGGFPSMSDYIKRK